MYEDVTAPPAPRWVLVVALLGSTMAFLDATVVGVALPVIQTDLGATVDQAQWVIEAYALFLASLVLVGGALGDRLGRRRVFSTGVALFALASAACALASTPLLLVVARGVQGIGGALLVPGSLALISATYAEEERGKAIGTWSSFSSITSALGPVLGGWVVTHASWRWLFVLNVPLGILVLVLAARHVPESRDPDAPPRMDLLGALLAVSGLALVVEALLAAPSRGGPTAVPVIAQLVAGAAAVVVFVVVEARRRYPMVPLALFRSRTFTGANVLTVLLYASLSGLFFFLPFDLILVQRYSPAEAGAALLPFIVLVSLLSPWTGKLAGRIGPRLPLVVGPAVAAAGFALLGATSGRGSYWTAFFPGMVVLGVGMGFTVAPLTAAVMGSVDVHRAGVASGINNAVARVAGLLSVAGLGVVLIERFDRALDQRLASLPLAEPVAAVVARERPKLAAAALPSELEPSLRQALQSAFDDAYVEGFRLVVFLCALLALGGALAALLLIAPRAKVTPPAGARTRSRAPSERARARAPRAPAASRRACSTRAWSCRDTRGSRRARAGRRAPCRCT